MMDGSAGAAGVCWDPMVGMYRAASGCPSGVFEQISAPNEGVAHAA